MHPAIEDRSSDRLRETHDRWKKKRDGFRIERYRVQFNETSTRNSWKIQGEEKFWPLETPSIRTHGFENMVFFVGER